jgi:hypothetical protein
VIDPKEAQSPQKLAFIEVQLSFVSFCAILCEHHREIAENVVPDGFSVAYSPIRDGPLEIGLGSLEELRHQHSRDTVVATADGIANEMNQTFRRQEILGPRIRLSCAAGERGPILGQRNVDLPFDARRAGQDALIVLLHQWTCHIAPFQQRVLLGVQSARPSSGDRKRVRHPEAPRRKYLEGKFIQSNQQVS